MDNFLIFTVSIMITTKKSTKMENLKNTNLWIVLNEETLNTMKGKGGKTAKFKTEEEANFAASSKLNMWVCVNVHFNHKFLNHTI